MQATKNNPYAESSAPPSQVDDLYDHIRTFRRFPKGYMVLHLHFSILDRLHQQPHHRRSIATAFNRLINPYEGKLFWTREFDLFFVSKDCPHADLDRARVEAMRAVNDAPVLKQKIADGQDDQLCTWWDLGEDYEQFYSKVEQLRRTANHDDGDEEKAETPSLKNMVASIGSSSKPKPAPSPSQDIEAEKTGKKQKTVPQYEHIFPETTMDVIGPMQLDKLERNILNMDMFNLIAQQNICVVVENMPPQVVFTKKYISLDEVNNSILPGYAISGDKWLFQRLTETFDTKMMQALVDYESFPENVLSINMNVSTISTKAFDKFIAKQKSVSEHPLILEITLFDIMSDLTAYFRAQEKLDRLGCKICICKMDIQSLYVLDRELINVDFLKIRWNKSYRSSLNTTERKRIADAIQAQGKMRVVLSDCDSKEAISFGNEMGIVMFQGFEIDKLQGIE